MTDFEMTKLCAQAMALGHEWDSLERVFLLGTFDEHSPHPQCLEMYDPLEDDAQAMTLVKRFALDITNSWGEEPKGHWFTVRGTVSGWEQTKDADLNRAIVECVAKMQLETQKHDATL